MEKSLKAIKKRINPLFIILIGMISCMPSRDDKSLDTVYFEGEILTMEGD